MPALISKDEYMRIASRCLLGSIAKAFAGGPVPVVVGESARGGGLELTVLILCDYETENLGVRAGEALDALTRGKGHGPMQIVERDVPPSGAKP